jgi:hypothetical protein
VSARALKDKAITEKEVAAQAFTAEVIKKQSLTADLFKPGQLPAGQDGTDGHNGAVGPTAGAVSATGNAEGGLNPNAPSATATVTLPAQSKLLIQGVDNYSVDCTPADTGPAAIGLYLDDAFVPGSRRNLTFRPGQISAGILVTMGIVSNVAAGTHTVKVASTPGCTGTSGLEGLVSAIALGG